MIQSLTSSSDRNYSALLICQIRVAEMQAYPRVRLENTLHMGQKPANW